MIKTFVKYLTSFTAISLLVFLIITACQPKEAGEYIKSGLQASEQGNYKKAERKFSTAIKKDTSNIDWYYLRAFYALEKTKKYEEALADYNKLIERGESTYLAEAYCERGYIRYLKGDYRDAVQDIQQSLSIEPKNPLAYRNRALIFIAIKNINMICFDLNKAIEYGYRDKYGDDIDKLIEEYCNE